MVDAGIKKAIIKNKDLPYVSFNDTDLFYDIRYRVVSDDKNRTSQYSPITRLVVPPTSIANMPYTSTDRIIIKDLGSAPKLITCVWTYPTPTEYDADPDVAKYEAIFSDVNIFDVWIAWKVSGTWESYSYYTTTTANNFSLLHRADNPSDIRIAIQIPTNNKVYDTRLSLFQKEQSI
jgi:hypothetical protein